MDQSKYWQYWIQYIQLQKSSPVSFVLIRHVLNDWQSTPSLDTNVGVGPCRYQRDGMVSGVGFYLQCVAPVIQTMLCQRRQEEAKSKWTLDETIAFRKWFIWFWLHNKSRTSRHMWNTDRRTDRWTDRQIKGRRVGCKCFNICTSVFIWKLLLTELLLSLVLLLQDVNTTSFYSL